MITVHDRLRYTAASLLLLCAMILWTLTAHAEDAPPLPADWAAWTSVTTPLTKVGALPGCDADVSALPPIYQETVATYCSVKPGGPGKVAVLIKPTVVELYKKRQGGYPDGVNLLLHLKDMQVFFATYYRNGAPGYAVYTEAGEPAKVPSGHVLHADTCMTCHTGYGAYCVAGQCGSAQ